MMNFPNPDAVKAHHDELIRRGEQERLASQFEANQVSNFRRTVELLIGWMKSQDARVQKTLETYEPIAKPSKLATDSGIHVIRR
ncbi:MAG: hypothetical protein K8I30_11190 [Anaerolineae bacterium]|nr:hypothetical protein [Anaerolineae bacterium]